MSGRSRILSRVAEAIEARARTEHPGRFGGWRPEGVRASSLDDFETVFGAAGGEVVRVPDRAEAAEWIGRFAAEYASTTVGRSLPDELTPEVPRVEPEDAALGISMALGAVGETGSLLMDARDGRRTQLLAPVHVVVVRASDIHATLIEALWEVQSDLSSAIGLHSGPSKSADIGQVVVQGVHGPGRVIAVVVDSWASADHPEDGVGK